MLKSMSRPLARCVADDLPDLTAIEADILQFAVVVLVERIERGLALAIGQHLGNPAVDGATQPSERQKPLFAQTGLGKSVCHVRHGHGRLPWKRFGCQRRAPVLQGGSDPAVSVAVKKSSKAGLVLLRSELPHGRAWECCGRNCSGRPHFVRGPASSRPPSDSLETHPLNWAGLRAPCRPIRKSDVMA